VARLFTLPTFRQSIPTKPVYKAPVDIPALPTGFRSLDKALGIGGLPYGKIIELIGPSPTFRSGTVCLASRMAAKVQLQQGIVTIIDMEHCFDPWQAERCGLRAPHLLLTRPDTVFTALAALESATQHADMVMVMMGLVAELLQDVEPDLLRTLLGRLRKIVRTAKGVTLFVTAVGEDDPLRARDAIFGTTPYPAGFPLAQIAEVRLWVQDEAWSNKDGLTTAYKANVTVVKNELATAGRGASVRIKLDSF
jgi:recombination protein RecA